jgi:hypothetical protein
MPPIMPRDVEVYISQENAKIVTDGANDCMKKGSQAKEPPVSNIYDERQDGLHLN